MASLCRASILYIPSRCFRRNITNDILTAKSSSDALDRKLRPTKLLDSLPDRYVGQPSWKTHPSLMKDDETTPGVSRNEYVARRDELMKKLTNKLDSPDSKALNSAKHLIVLQAASVAFSAPDVPHPFRQDSNFLYLTGFQEPDSILVLNNDGEGGCCQSVLFVDSRDEHKELWEGPRAGVDGALALTGVDYVYEKQEFYTYLHSYATRRFVLWRDPSKLPLISSKNNPSRMDVDQYLSSSTGDALNPIPTLHELRWIKSEAEIALLDRAGRIGAEALKETMRFSHPNVCENVLAAKMDMECRLRGANGLAYPPVVAGGARANIIHYLNNDQCISERENLVLMDAGCDLHGYVSDITRTWPVSGRFSDQQRVLYEIVYDVQRHLLEYVATVRPVTLRDVFMTMLQLLAVGIREAGIMKTVATSDDIDEDAMRDADRFCPHHVSHYLGMDVHDVECIPKNIDLKPGVVITVEPGIYIKPNDQKVKEEFRGYGIRIEDDVLITDTGAIVLTDAVPKSADEIEQLMRQ